MPDLPPESPFENFLDRMHSWRAGEAIARPH